MIDRCDFCKHPVGEDCGATSFDVPEHGVDNVQLCVYHSAWVDRWLDNGKWPDRILAICDMLFMDVKWIFYKGSLLRNPRARPPEDMRMEFALGAADDWIAVNEREDVRAQLAHIWGREVTAAEVAELRERVTIDGQ